MNTYLDEAIETYRKITSLDFTIYSEFVFEYLQKNGVETLEDIKLFQQFAQYDVMDNEVYCERKENGSYSIEPQKMKDGVKLKVDKVEIESEVKKLNPSVLSGTLVTILSILAYIKQVRKKYPTPLSTIFNHGEYIEVLNDLEDNKKQALIYLALLQGDESSRDKIIEDWNIQIFSYLSKSILNAEYLIFNDYKTKLDQIELFFDEKFESVNEVSRKIGRFYTEKAFLRVSWYLQEACSFIKRYLSDNQESNLLLVNSDRRKRFRRKEIYKNKYLGAEKTKVYEALLESIIEMTIIDHYFRSDAETVEKLFHLYEQVKEQKGNKTLSDNKLYKEVIDEVLAKVATMLDLILNNEYHKHTDPQIDVDYYYIINSRKSKDDFIINELAQYCKRDTSGNVCIRERKEHEGGKIDCQIAKFEYEEESFSDLKLYYEAVTTGMVAYEAQSEIISKIHRCTNKNCSCTAKCALQTTDEGVENANILTAEKEKEALPSIPLCTEQEVVDAIKQFIEKQPANLSPSFFRQVLEFIDKLIVKEDSHPTIVAKGEISKIREYHILLKKVLDLLFNFLNKFASDIPFSYRPYFESSFYSCSVEKGIIYNGIKNSDISEYKIENFENKFFFASIDCMPINYLYMSKLYNKYKVRHKEQVYTFDEESRKALRKEFNTLSDEVKTKLDVETEQVNQVVQDALEDNKKLVDEKLEETSKNLTSKNLEHMIVSLGIFAAFIAFVTISINLVKVAQNIWQYIVFSCTFTSCLLLFVIYLKHGETIMSHIKAKIGGPWNVKRILKYLITGSFSTFAIIGIMNFTSRLPVFNPDIQLQNQDSIINTYLNKQKQMSEDYELLLKDYKVLKAEKDSLQLSIPSVKEAPLKDSKSKSTIKRPR